MGRLHEIIASAEVIQMSGNMSLQQRIRLGLGITEHLAGLCFWAVAVLADGLNATPLGAESSNPAVDVELILAVDVSASITSAEQKLQRDGYIAAFRHPDMLQAIQYGGARGRIAVTYMEWSGPEFQRVVRPWTIISNRDEAEQFADELAREPISSHSSTSISSALLLAEYLFDHSGMASERRIIDVSGDGPNNTGPPITSVRDRLVGSGISINGLPMSLDPGGTNRFENFAYVSSESLETYYHDCVIGGQDAFVIGINDISQFEVAIHRKLIREIADMPAHRWFAASRQAKTQATDCTALGQTLENRQPAPFEIP